MRSAGAWAREVRGVGGGRGRDGDGARAVDSRGAPRADSYERSTSLHERSTSPRLLVLHVFFRVFRWQEA